MKTVLGIDFGMSYTWLNLKYQDKGEEKIISINPLLKELNKPNKGIPTKIKKNGKEKYDLKYNLWLGAKGGNSEAIEDVKEFFKNIFNAIRDNRNLREVINEKDIQIIIGKPVQYKGYDEKYEKYLTEAISTAMGESHLDCNFETKVIDEPILAAFAIFKKKPIKDDVLVIDIGAGTMDWAFFKQTSNKPIITTGGENYQCAGNPFNKTIMSMFNLQDEDYKVAIKIKEGLHLTRVDDLIIGYASYLATKNGGDVLTAENKDFYINQAYEQYNNGLRRYYVKKLDKYIAVNDKHLRKCEAFDNVKEDIKSEKALFLYGLDSQLEEKFFDTANELTYDKELTKNTPSTIIFVGGSSNMDKLCDAIIQSFQNILDWNCNHIRISSISDLDLFYANAVAYGACSVPANYTKKQNEDFIEGKKTFDKGNYNKAFSYFVKAEKEFEGKALLKDDDYAKSLYYIAEIYSKQNKSKEANKYYKKARTAFIKLDDKEMVEKCASKIK